LIRNGSRGAFWLEPLLEVTTSEGRIGFGCVDADDVPNIMKLLIAAESAASEHSSYLGLVEELPWFADQQRLTFARAGLGDPLSIENYKSLGGFAGLDRALNLSSQAIVDAVTESGLRGRGGAAFPTGIKWQAALDAGSGQKYIVCNADEGDSGTFADRLLMEADPYQLIEGMLIAGIAVGASEGYIYLRSEYPVAHRIMRQAIERAGDAGYLGTTLSNGTRFDIELRLGAGAYICGEETALLDSIEGKRGMVRVKPPLPVHEGLFGKPTVMNNVLTLAAVSTIMAEGAEHYRGFGVGRSRGTLPVQLAGNIKRGGLLEVAFGTPLRELLDDFGGGSYSGSALRAVQVGGPLGAYLPESQWGTPLDYEALAAIDALLGHGGLVAFDKSVDMSAQARFAMEFCAIESCGKCTPCRIGSVRGVEVIDRIVAGEQRDKNLLLLQDLCDTMEQGSLCAMGALTPLPVRSCLTHFSEDFRPAR